MSASVLGFLTGASIALLAFGLLALCCEQHASRGPERAGPGRHAGEQPRTRTSTTPGSTRSARNKAKAPSERVEAWEEALREGKAGQNGKRAYVKAGGGAAAAPTVRLGR